MPLNRAAALVCFSTIWLSAGCATDQPVPTSGHLQTAFRVRADFAVPLNADEGWAGALNENVAIQADQPFRLRFEIAGAAGAPDTEFRLQYRRNGGDWTEVDAQEFPYSDEDDSRTPRVSIVTCDAYENGAATTDLLSGSSASFRPGVGISLADRNAPWAAGGSHGEFEWALVVRRFADGAVTNEQDDTFEFRMIDASGAALVADANPTLRLDIPSGHMGGTFVETPGRIGPWQAASGDLYFIMEPAETDNVFMMVKSTDHGRTWREVDAANRPATDDLESVDGRQVGDTIHIVHQVTESVRYHAFRTSDHPTHPDTWGVRDETAAEIESIAQAAALVVRSDRSMVAFYVGDTVHYAIRSSEGAWTATAPVGPGLAGPQAVLGANDTVHVAGYGTDGTIWYRRLLPDGTLTPALQLATGAGTSRAEYGAVLPLVFVPETNTVVILYRLADGRIWERRVVGNGQPTPPVRVTDRDVITDAVDSQQPAADVVLDGGTLRLLFVEPSSRSIFGTEDAGGWQPSEVRLDGIAGSWVRGNVYTRPDGVRVYGFVYDAGSEGGSGMNRFAEVVLGQRRSDRFVTPSLRRLYIDAIPLSHNAVMTSHIRRALSTFVVLGLSAIIAAVPVRGQSGAASGLTGQVVDQTGAPMTGVTVTIARPEAGFERTTVTDETGNWEARFLPPGTYRVTFQHSGFKVLRREGVAVTTGQLATVDASLEVGNVEEAVSVTADARMVSADSAAIVRTLDRKELEALPTSARNITQLLAIEPGVSADISELLSNDNASISPSVNGARTTNNSFVFNGIDVTNMLCCNSRTNGSRGTIDAGGGTLSRNIAPAPETLQEVKLQTSLYDASTGRNGGGIFQVVSKSGTNLLTGTGYYYLQDDALLANDYFFERAGLDKPKLERNEGGFTLGGPIVPSRTFFFGSYQATRADTSFVDEASNTVLMPAALTDDRSAAGIDRFVESVWNTDEYGPVNLAAVNPISRALLQARFPDGSLLVPSGSSGFNCEPRDEQVAASCEVVSIIPATFEQDQFSLNLDHQVSAANRLGGKYFFSNQPSRDPLADSAALTLHEREETTYQRTLSVTDVHAFASGMVNEVRVGFFRNRNDSIAVPYFTNAEFGITNPFAATVPDLTQVTIDGDDVGGELRFGTLGDGTRIFDRQTTWTLGNTLSLIRGRHSLRVGGEWRRNFLDGDLQETRNRRHNFDAWMDFLTVGYANPEDNGRRRQISDTGLNVGSTVRNFRLTDWSWFIADDWRVSPNLTINLGLRHDYYGFPSEQNGFLALYDYPAAVATGNLQDGFLFASNFDPASVPGAAGLDLNVSSRETIVPPDRDNFSPRVSFAWLPFEDREVVFRGGYGLFYERITGAFANSLRQGPPFFRELQLNDAGDWNTIPNDVSTFPVPGMRVGFDDGEPILVGDNDPDIEFEAFETQMVSPDLETPYLHQWNVTSQWELRPNWLLEVGYVGSKGSKLLQWANLNQAIDIEANGFLPRAGVPGGGFIGNYFEVVDDEFVNLVEPPDGCIEDDPGDCTISGELRGSLLGFDEDEGANFLSNGGRSEYHSLQMSLQRRFHLGYMFNVNYTLSKSMDTFSDEGLFQIEHDQTRPDLNWARSDFDRRHRLIFSFVWELPFSGNRFAEGWQLSGVGTLQSGRPFTITDEDFSGFLFESQNPRPNLAPGMSLDDQETSGSMESRVEAYLNRDAFESSGAQFGTLPRNSVTGPGQRRLDISLSKITTLSGNRSLEFRIEAYNITNTTSFRNPESDLGSANFGQITRTRGGPRLVQLGFKLRF